MVFRFAGRLCDKYLFLMCCLFFISIVSSDKEFSGYGIFALFLFLDGYFEFASPESVSVSLNPLYTE